MLSLKTDRHKERRWPEIREIEIEIKLNGQS